MRTSHCLFVFQQLLRTPEANSHNVPNIEVERDLRTLEEKVAESHRARESARKVALRLPLHICLRDRTPSNCVSSQEADRRFLKPRIYRTRSPRVCLGLDAEEHWGSENRRDACRGETRFYSVRKSSFEYVPVPQPSQTVALERTIRTINATRHNGHRPAVLWSDRRNASAPPTCHVHETGRIAKSAV